MPWEAVADRSLGGQLELHNEFQARNSYIVRQCLRKKIAQGNLVLTQTVKELTIWNELEGIT